jgi:hypothetical protein
VNTVQIVSPIAASLTELVVIALQAEIPSGSVPGDSGVSLLPSSRN